MRPRRLPLPLLRLLVHGRRALRTLARRVAVACSLVAWLAWGSLYLLTSGVGWIVGAVALGVSAAVGALCWLVSGE